MGPSLIKAFASMATLDNMPGQGLFRDSWSVLDGPLPGDGRVETLNSIKHHGEVRWSLGYLPP